jgi:hypothetical protein
MAGADSNADEKRRPWMAFLADDFGDLNSSAICSFPLAQVK